MDRNKTLIRLRGLGGCFKSTLCNLLPEFHYIPGTTRVAHSMRLGVLNQDLTNVAFDAILSKFCQDKTVFDLVDGVFITERSLLDYVFLNNYATDADKIPVNEVLKYESQLESKCSRIIDFTIKMSDDNFIDKLMSEDDIRARFYRRDPVEYKKLQDAYFDFLKMPIDFDVHQVRPTIVYEMRDQLIRKLHESK